MTFTEIEAILKEVEKRFRERTPARRIDEVAASYRVSRSEMQSIAENLGIRLVRVDDVFEVELLRLMVKLRNEFPEEQWSGWNSATREFARKYNIRLPK